ncbi:MAG: hypothetical protein Q7T58_02270 [Methylotenera sp.]|nr:hypothetical protein [Methylotenera sp.]
MVVPQCTKDTCKTLMVEAEKNAIAGAKKEQQKWAWLMGFV